MFNSELWSQGYDNALQNKDADKLNILLSDDFEFITYDGLRFDKQNYIRLITDSDFSIDHYEIKELETKMFQNTVIQTGKGLQSGKQGSEPYCYNLRFTNVWVQQGESWQLVSEHESNCSAEA